MKKRNITLCAVAMLCMQGYAKADTFTLKGDNTCVENYAQMTAAYKSNRPKMKKRLFTSKAVEAEILRVKKLLTNPKLAWMLRIAFLIRLTLLYTFACWTVNPILLFIPVTSMLCGCVTPVRRCGHMCS